MKQKQFRVTEYELIRNRQPLNSWAVAHLFYGVPRWAKKIIHHWNGDIIFTN